MKKQETGWLLLLMVGAFFLLGAAVYPKHPATAGKNCRSCHVKQFQQWSDPHDLHALSAAAVLTDKTHNTEEQLDAGCLKCHSPFEVPLGVGHFVAPLNRTGFPRGKWTVKNQTDWHAVRCEVCHDLASRTPALLAKYGSELDGPWHNRYLALNRLPEAYQKIISLKTGDTSTYIYPDQKALPVLAVKLCNSCHDPADEGDEASVFFHGINLGPQGGDSRVYVSTSHKGFSCIDCHNPHTFEPVNPKTKPVCMRCHSVPRKGSVHLNHFKE